MSDIEARPGLFLAFPGGCLRPRRGDDEEVNKAWSGINHPENRMYLMRRHPQSFVAQQEWLRKPDSPTDLVLVIEFENEAIGTMGVHGIDMIHGTATTGALIWDQKHWNRGIGYNAKMVLLDYLFNMLNLRIIYSKVIGFNGRSAKYSDKCGYKLVATLEDHFRFGDHFEDELFLSVTRDRFMPLWQQFQIENSIETLNEIVERHKGVNKT